MPQPDFAQRPVDELARAHAEAGMLRADALRQRADDLVVGAALARRLDELRPEHDVLVAAALVEVVVLHEHRRRQHDVGHQRRLGHELLVHADEEVVAGKAPLHELLLRRDRDRVGVLDQHRGHRRAVQQRLGIAGEHAADLRLVELAHGGVAHVEALDQGLAPVVDRAVVVEGAAALVLPGAGDRRDAGGGVHVDDAVALAPEAVAEAEEGALRRADEPREGLDLVDRKAGDGRRPGRIAACADAPRARADSRCIRRGSPNPRSRRGRARA